MDHELFECTTAGLESSDQKNINHNNDEVTSMSSNAGRSQIFNKTYIRIS